MKATKLSRAAIIMILTLLNVLLSILHKVLKRACLLPLPTSHEVGNKQQYKECN
jgi:hypothetical protein